MSMAIIITIRDDEDDTAKVDIQFEPPLKQGENEEQPTTHLIALQMLEAVSTLGDIVGVT
jgi:hypothetical protein